MTTSKMLELEDQPTYCIISITFQVGNEEQLSAQDAMPEALIKELRTHDL